MIPHLAPTPPFAVGRLPLAGFLILAPVVYLAMSHSPWLGVTSVVATTVAVLTMSIIHRAFVREAALSICVLLIIVFPGLLPRPEPDRVSPVFGGSFDVRAGYQLAIVLVLALAAIWLWVSTRGSIVVFTQPPLLTFAAYCALILLSLAYTPDRAWAAFAAIKLFEAVLIVAVLAVLVRTSEELMRLINAMLVAIAIVLIFYWIDILNGSALVDRTSRLKTSWMGATDAGILAATFTAVVAARFFTTQSWRHARGAGVLTCLGTFTALIIGGKAGLVSGFFALLLTTLIVLTRRTSYSKATRFLVAGLGLSLVACYVIWDDLGIVAHFRSYEQPQYLDSETLTGRLPVWSSAIELALSSPILGHGYMSTYAIGLEGYYWTAPSAHNAMIQTFFDLGLIGLTFVLGIYLHAWCKLIQQLLDHFASHERWSLSVELLAALTVLTLSSFTEDILGGVFEARTMVLMLVIFAVHKNLGARLRLDRAPTILRAQTHLSEEKAYGRY